MKKLSFILALTIACSSLAMADTFRKKNNSGLWSGMSMDSGGGVPEISLFGTGYFPSSDYDSSAGVGVSFGYFYDENLGAEFSISDFGGDEGDHLRNYTLDGVYRFNAVGFTPYLLGGVGLHDHGETEMMLRFGAGMNFQFSEVISLFADGAYNFVRSEFDNYPSVRAGIRFSF